MLWDVWPLAETRQNKCCCFDLLQVPRVQKSFQPVNDAVTARPPCCPELQVGTQQFSFAVAKTILTITLGRHLSCLSLFILFVAEAGLDLCSQNCMR